MPTPYERPARTCVHSKDELIVRLHLIDGTFELFRAHFSPRPGRADPSGRDVKATIGVLSSLISLLHDRAEQCTHVAVAFDNPIRSFRNDLFADYKSGEGTPEEIKAQFDLVEQATGALGIAVWPMDQWEADDALASGAAQFVEQVEQVRIMSPDKDLGQCLTDPRVVQIDRMRGRLIDAAAVRERRGVDPQNIPDWLALVGDTADGIPGIAGFGEKGTAAVLGRYGTIEAIPALARDWDLKVRGAKRLAENLAAQRADALLYKKLATLVTDVPLPHTLEQLRWRGPKLHAWAEMCQQLGAPSMQGRPPARRD